MKKVLHIVILLFAIAASKQNVQAQIIFDCVDTSRINDYYICGNPIYQPVCGCNGITYRNDCAAYYRGGVNYWNNGTCGNFGFDILSNPVLNELVLSIYTRNSERVLVEVWSTVGPKIFTRTINSAQESVQQLFIETDAFEIGSYILLVVVNGEFQSQKFIKASIE
jgi:hypothetical protein